MQTVVSLGYLYPLGTCGAVVTVAQRSSRAKRKGRRRDPEVAKVRSARRERWTGGQEGRGLYLPIAEGLTEADLPRLEAAARRQMERNRMRIEHPYGS